MKEQLIHKSIRLIHSRSLIRSSPIYRLIFVIALSIGLSLSASAKEYKLETLADNLDYPWSIAFLPSGDMLITEREGQLLKLSANGQTRTEIANVPETYAAGQGGFFDVVLDQDFANNQKIYLSFAAGDKKANATTVVSAILNKNNLENIKTLLTVSPTKNTRAHYGGRLVQLKDGSLVLTTGDGFNFREASQDPFNQMGKVIRMNSDGSVPADNPYADGKSGNPYVYAYGFRNPQGLFYDQTNDVLYVHEHGPKGGDELNQVEAGRNYGWPATSYGVNYSGARVSPYTSLPGIEEPLIYWTPSVGPSGMTLYNGDKFPQWRASLFVGTLVYRDVRLLTLVNGKVTDETIIFDEIGARIRDVRTGPDGYIYLLTDKVNGELIRVLPKQ